MEKYKEIEDFHPSYKVIETTEETKKNNTYPKNEDKIIAAEKFKAEGNEFYKQKNYKKALSCYHRVFLMLNGFLDPNSEYSKYISKKTEPVSEDTLEKIKEIKQNTYLNMAQIYIFIGNYSKALDSANKSLEIKETLKGYYRRGCVYIEINELEKAKNDFYKIREIEKQMGIENITDLEEKFAIIKQKEKKSDEEMKNKLKKMFV